MKRVSNKNEMSGKIHNIFRLNRTEIRVFDTLSKTDYSIDRFRSDRTHTNKETSENPGKRVSELATLLRLPRMTCHDAIKSLKKRGLVTEKRLGKDKFYSITDSDTVVNTVREFFPAATDTRVVNQTNKKIDNGILIYNGLENCHAVWRKIADLQRGDRFICIQPNASLRATFDKIGVKALYPSNDALNSKGIIIEGLVHTDCYEEIFKSLTKVAGYDFALKELEKFAHRTASVSLIDTKYLTSPTEMFFMHNTAYIVNWKDEVAIEIHNKVTRDFLFELYALARGYGKKINQSAHTQTLVNKLRAAKNVTQSVVV